MKEKIFSLIENYRDELVGLADKIYDHPETALKEIFAVGELTSFLRDKGFEVKTEVGGLKTAFKTVMKNGEGGPIIGLLGEYDALEGVGHACGHHLQTPALIGAMIALRETLPREQPWQIVLYGTPGEEGGGGKVIMAKNGCFSEIQVALMVHGGDTTTVDPTTYANLKYTVTFKGKASHAAAHPAGGRSAFDALLLAMKGVEFMREHISNDAKIHYAPIHAGHTPANIVPESSQGEFILRCMRNSYLNDMERRFKNIIEGAALMTGTTYDLEKGMGYKACIPNQPLINLFYGNAALAGAERIVPPRDKTGSTDFGDVMQFAPGICARIAFAPKGTGAHSPEWLKIGKTEEAHQSIITAAKTIAGMAIDLIMNPELMQKIWEDYKIQLNKVNGS